MGAGGLDDREELPADRVGQVVRGRGQRSHAAIDERHLAEVLALAALLDQYADIHQLDAAAHHALHRVPLNAVPDESPPATEGPAARRLSTMQHALVRRDWTT